MDGTGHLAEDVGQSVAAETALVGVNHCLLGAFIPNLRIWGSGIGPIHLPFSNHHVLLTGVARSLSFFANVLGSTIPVNVTIENSFKATIDFTLSSAPYSFAVIGWQSRRLRNFLEHFHSVSGRDPVHFGVLIEQPDGTRGLYESSAGLTLNSDESYTVDNSVAKAMTVFQKLNAVEQGCRDVLKCLNMIAEVHGPSILDYCVWFSENHAVTDYSSLITMITALCVVHTDFISPTSLGRW